MLETHHKTVFKIKLTFILLITFFLKSNLYCQSLDRIKEVDTLYIYFDKKKKKSRTKQALSNEKSDFFKNYIVYSFNPDPLNTIYFNSNTYKDTDNMRKGIKNDERVE